MRWLPLGLKRFIEGIHGVDTVDMGNLAIAIRFDESAIDEGTIQSIAKDNIERLGYRIEEWQARDESYAYFNYCRGVVQGTHKLIWMPEKYFGNYDKIILSR